MDEENELLMFEEVRYILNKLTANNFYTSVVQIENMEIATKEKLQEVIDLIYERAMDEPDSCALYAFLCYRLKQIAVFLIEKVESVDFKFLVLMKCQEEFEQNKYDNTKFFERTKDYEHTMDGKQKEFEYKAEENSYLKRKLGNVQFIGELFKLCMFSEKTIHEYISKLLNQGDDMSLESMCWLLRTSGKELEIRSKDMSQQIDKTKNDISVYMAEIQKIVDKHQTSNRVRFMLLDIISLRKNRWQPKRCNVGPKTLEQIFQEAGVKLQKQQSFQNSYFKHEKPSKNNVTTKETPKSFRANMKRIMPVVEEYCTENFKNIIKSVLKLYSPNTTHSFISSAIIVVLRRTKEDRYLLGVLLQKLVQLKYIKLIQCNMGLVSVLAQIDGHISRIPLIWDYFADIIVPMINEHYVPLFFLKETLRPFSPSQTAGEIMAAILRCVSEVWGILKARAMWQDSGLQWSSFLPPSKNLSKFLKTHAVEFTIHPTTVQYPIDKMSSVENIRRKLDLFFITDPQNVEQIVNWIETYLNVHTLGPILIVPLVEAVFENAMYKSKGKHELDTEKLKLWLPVIQPYVARNLDCEFITLEVVKMLVFKLRQPQGLLNRIFDILYGTEIISEQAFYDWTEKFNPITKNKLDVLNSVYPFFTWLEEAALTRSNINRRD